jgi:hypothetical protein
MWSKQKLYCYLSLCLLFSFFSFGCLQNKQKNETKRGFYYWKTNFEWTLADQTYAKKLKISRLYVRFFDIDATYAAAQPQGVLQIANELPTEIEIVPVVYITQAAIKQTVGYQVDTLAKRLVVKVKNMLQRQGINQLTELQIDCDWTEKNQETYFVLLQKIRETLNQKFGSAQKTPLLSCTIRLYPMKYYKKMGIPPVDKGMLMCYNLENPTALKTKQAILSFRTAAGYLSALSAYPLPLDVGLPLFSWAAQFRNKQFLRLLHEVKNQDLQDLAFFKPLEPNFYEVTQSIDFQGNMLIAGDILRVDEPNLSEIKATAELLNEKLLPYEDTKKNTKNSFRNVILFDYQSQKTAKQFAESEIDKLYQCFE